MTPGATAGLIAALISQSGLKLVPQIGHGQRINQVRYDEAHRHLLTLSSGVFKLWRIGGVDGSSLLLWTAPASELELLESMELRVAQPAQRPSVFRVGEALVEVLADGGFRWSRGQTKLEFSGDPEPPVDLSFSEAGELIVAHRDGTVRAWRFGFARPWPRLGARFWAESKLHRMALAPGGRQLALTSEGRLLFYDTLGRDARWVKILRGPGERMGPLDVAEDFVAMSVGNALRILAPSGAEKRTRKVLWGEIVDLEIGPSKGSEGALIAAIYEKGRVAFFSPKGELVSYLDLDGSPVALAFAPSGERVAVAQRDGWIVLVNVQGAVERAFMAEPFIRDVGFGQEGAIFSSGASGLVRWTQEGRQLLLSGPSERMAISADQRSVAIISSGAVRLWREGARPFTLIAQRERWLVHDGARIVASPQGAQLAALVAPDLSEAAPLERFERFQPLSFEPAALEGEPGLGWISRSAQLGDRVELQLELEARSSTITEYQLWAHGTKVLERAVSVAPGRQARAIESIALEEGAQPIQLRVRDEVGRVYKSAPIELAYSGERRPRLHFVGLGIREHSDPALRLKYADKDAVDLRTLFSLLASRRKYSFSATLRLNNRVTEQAVQTIAKELERSATAEDILVVFAAGHVHPLLEELAQVIEEARPRRKLVLLDVASAPRSEERAEYLALAERRNLRARIGSEEVEQARSWQEGLWVLSASRPGEISFEVDIDSNGLFTQALINGLSSARADANKDRKISIEELAAYVERAVHTRSYQRQTPALLQANPARMLDFERVSRPWDRPGRPLR